MGTSILNRAGQENDIFHRIYLTVLTLMNTGLLEVFACLDTYCTSEDNLLCTILSLSSIVLLIFFPPIHSLPLSLSYHLSSLPPLLEAAA